MSTFNDFRRSIGKKFRIRGFTSGKFSEQDTIIRVHDHTQEVEGEKFIANYKDCRFVQKQPAQLTTRK